MPFAQRLTCTIGDACEVTGLGRTKLYELIAARRIATTTIGRRRLVVVRSLLASLAAPELGSRKLYANLGRAVGLGDDNGFFLIWNPGD
ncbi:MULTISPECIES: helix-turn-helix domain-containing protein [unclassified Bradyrhizobium]